MSKIGTAIHVQDWTQVVAYAPLFGHADAVVSISFNVCSDTEQRDVAKRYHGNSEFERLIGRIAKRSEVL